jgi:hypothetical protein
VQDVDCTVQKDCCHWYHGLLSLLESKRKGDKGNDGCVSHQTAMICSVCLEPFEHNLKGLPLGLLDGFILVLSNNCKACDLNVS